MLKKLVLPLLLLPLLPLSAVAQQEPEAVSWRGTKFFAQADEKNQVAEAARKLAADPKNVDLIIALGRAQAGVWRYRDAIATYTRGLEIAPENAMLYRHRGHRYISTRQFDRAIKDMNRAAQLNDKDFDIWYHLGLAYYLKGDFKRAAQAYERCLAVADKDDSVIAVSDWLYMTYRRLKKEAEADRVLARITPGMKVEENRSYFDRLLLYKGLKKESDIINDKMTDLDIATVGYGMGNWHLYNGDRAKAREYFERVVSGKYWPAFGFIASEAELARLR
ncbi:MAG TPA: tetratricopeptide repeat protein [Blastocatellia bacterium]|nr:tetratricopeptide repeat protein [Blastocatellia bacterium]